MVDMQDQELQVRKLKRLLEGWRIALLPLKSIILWEQQWHPCAIVGALSFLYFIIWLIDMNSLATFAVIGLFVNLVDFIVPIVCNSVCGPNFWTGQKEKVFEDICKSLVSAFNKLLQQVSDFYNLRETSPIVYYVISITFLCTLAWVASSVNNIFLLYILSTVILLWPGVQHRGIVNTMLSMVNMAPKPAIKKVE